MKIVAFSLALLSAPDLAGAQSPGPAALPPPTAVSADAQASLLRRRFEQWLIEHRSQLSSSQIAAVQAAVELVTPALFQEPPNEGASAKQAAVGKKLYCSLGAELAYSFANGTSVPAKVDRSWTHTLQQWTEWVVDCVIP
jgi:hypothetical protein